MRNHRGFVVVLAFASFAATAAADDWPQWHGPKGDSVWRETGILEKFPADGPKFRWRVSIDGGYAGPAVADGRVYVTDYVTDGDRKPNPTKRSELKGIERVLCFSAADGKLLWKHEYPCDYAVSYPAGPRCTPTVHQGKVYTLGTEGNLFCLDAVKGTVLWSRELKKDYKISTLKQKEDKVMCPMWGFSGHPLIDGQRLICLVGGEGSVAVAFDKDTGKEIWRALSATQPGYSSPTIIEASGKRQLIIWHSEAVDSLDPETGKVYWTEPQESYTGMSIATPRLHGPYLFVGGVFQKSVMLKLAADKPAAAVAWRGKPKLGVYPCNCTPFFEDGHLYGVDQPGQLRCAKLETGERLWETLEPIGGKPGNCATVFIVKNGPRFFLFSDTGHLIIAKMSPKDYEEISRAKIIEPTGNGFGRQVVWTHPAFAQRCVFVRNDKELVCVSLAAE